MARTRLKPEDRREQIMTAAIKLAEQGHYQQITREQIANAAGVSVGLVSAHCGTMANLRRDIMRQAIRDSKVRIIAQGLVAGDTHARKAPTELKQRAMGAASA